MRRILFLPALFIIISSCQCAENNQTSSSDIYTINKITTIDIPSYKDGRTYKAAVSIDDRYKQDETDLLRFILSDEQGNTVIDETFKTLEKQFSIDLVDLDNNGQRDFIFIIKEKDFSHIHQTLIIQRKLWQTDLTKVLSIPYAGQTKNGTKWNYNHSYIRQEDGHFHIMLALEQEVLNETDSKFPVRNISINIGDKSPVHNLKESEPKNPGTWHFREDEYFIENLLGDTGYTVRANPKRGSYSKMERNPLRAIQVVDKDGNLFAERPFRGYFGGYRLALFDIDEDGDMEFIFVIQNGSGTGIECYEISVDKIVNGQFIQLLTCPLGEASSYTGDWGFSKWKYLGYGLGNPSKVAFEMSLNYNTSERFEGDTIPDNFPKADDIILLFEKDKYSINYTYSEDPDKRPLSKNTSGWNWIFK